MEFCNESAKDKVKIATSDVEFVHSQLLLGGETAEANALMKNDRIVVRKVRKAEREAALDRKRLQRDADRNYFQQIRHLLPDLGGSRTADVVLDCQGKIVDEYGRNQQVLSSTVKAHSAFIKKRCPWLYGMIKTAQIAAKAEQERMEAEEVRAEAFIYQDDTHIVQRVESDSKSADDDDDGIEVLSFPPQNGEEQKASSAAVAEIEDDDDDDDEMDFDDSVPRKISYTARSGFPAIVPPEKQAVNDCSLPRVTIQNHSPEAVKLLLEYCYANRVGSLGQEAFVQACKTRPMKHSGPIAPFPISSSGSRRWPKNGIPLVSFTVALAGVVIAEEAGLPRLSLMCEVAASQLLSPSNVVEALSLCHSQVALTGNDLALLRKAAMEKILGSGPRGVSELGRSQSFRRALCERRAHIIPTLLQGVMESVEAHEKSRAFKRDRKSTVDLFFQDLDSEDKYRRDKERKKRKLEQIHSDPNRQHELLEFEVFYDECRASSNRSLKRMAKHLESMPSRAITVLTSRGRYSFPNTSHRRSSSRRRSSGSGHHP